MKKILLIFILLIGSTACTTKKDNVAVNENGVELLSKEEVASYLEMGEPVTLRDKDVTDDILDQLNADRTYDYAAEIYADENYQDFIRVENDNSFKYPLLLSDEQLVQHFDEYYYALIYDGAITLIPNVQYVEIDGKWYKKLPYILASGDQIGNMVVNKEKLALLNKNK